MSCCSDVVEDNCCSTTNDDDDAAAESTGTRREPAQGSSHSLEKRNLLGSHRNVADPPPSCSVRAVTMCPTSAP